MHTCMKEAFKFSAVFTMASLQDMSTLGDTRMPSELMSVLEACLDCEQSLFKGGHPLLLFQPSTLQMLCDERMRKYACKKFSSCCRSTQASILQMLVFKCI